MGNERALIAVNGCLHGDFAKLIPLLSENTKLLLLLGDLQLLSTKKDLSTCSIPYKYTYNGNIQKISDFHRILKNDPKDELAQKFNSINCVLGIGGNHENMGLLEKLPFGGFVTENFFYMGYCNIIKYNGMKIAGISGIHKPEDVFKEREYGFQKVASGDFNWWRRNKVTSYHVRFLEVLPLVLYEADEENEEIDFVLSHDWPQNVFHNNDPQLNERLFKIKPFFKTDVASGKLGSRLYDLVMNNLRPSNWFSAHLHIKYKTTIEYENGDSTDFLALDKLLPNRLKDAISQFEFPIEEEKENEKSTIGNCSIELDLQFIKLQFWCYQNKQRISQFFNSENMEYETIISQIKELYLAEKNQIELETPLLKPFVSADPLEYTNEYLKKNLNGIDL
ncbi:hypothetical protein ACO0SA_000233 [Hanseniaspora valbyensis]